METGSCRVEGYRPRGESFALPSRGSDFGGKSRAAHLVWPRFGNVRTYTEPFYGSGAILLARELELGKIGIEWAPGDTIETVNDADPYVANFWRATSRHADRVAVIADYPVMEADLHARHQWLVDQSDFRERIFADPEYFDVKVAGWWVWGLSCWIGAGWCALGGHYSQKWTKGARPFVNGNAPGQGVHVKHPGRGDRGPRRLTGEPNLPKLGPRGLQGVHRQIPRTNAQGGMGVHGHRVSKKRPHLSGAGGGHGKGVHSLARSRLIPWFRALRHRLRPVRFVCGDFSRITGKSVVLPDHGYGGLFLDPPYPANADRHEELYSVDCGQVAHRAHEVALEWGAHPRVRVAFCGYEGTHDFPDDWEEVAWRSSGGYGGGQGGRGERNRGRERIYFSPACLKPAGEQLTL